jgi:hypothetical protein
MKQPYLVSGVVVLVVLIIIVGFLYIQQSSSFMSQISQATSSILGSSSASSTQATTTTASAQKTSAGSKTVTTTTKTTGSNYYSPTPVVGPRPVISEFEPPAGTIGSTITIVGTGFDYTTNYISFGTSQDLHYSSTGLADNVIATVASPDGKTLSFTVPSSTASGLLCNSINKCSGVSGKKITPGNYPITVSNRDGISLVRSFTVTAQ